MKSSPKTAKLIASLSTQADSSMRLPSRLSLVVRMILLASLTVGLALSFTGIRENFPSYVGTPACMMEVGGWIILAILASVAAAGNSRPRWPQPVGVKIVLQLSVVLFMALLVSFAWEGTHGGSTILVSQNVSWKCIVIAFFMVLSAGLILNLALYRAKPVSLDAFSTSIALVAGSLGMIIMGLTCPITEINHIIVSHLFPALAGMGIIFKVTKDYRTW